MKLFYKREPLQDNKDLVAQLELPGAEFAHILYGKIAPIEKDVKVAYMEGTADDGSKKKLFILADSKNRYISADGTFSLSKYSLEYIEKQHNLKNVELKESNFSELEIHINPTVYKKAYEILKDLYITSIDKTVEDKLGNNYRLVIVNNADMTIGEHLNVDELMLFDGEKKIGYLKAKYTTSKLMKLHGVEGKDFFLNKATIDFSNLDGEYKNRGLGYVMYFHMSQHLSQKGISFRQSTLCSDEAQVLWNGINNHWAENVKIKQIKSGKENIPVSFLSIGEDCILSFENNKPVIKKIKL